MSLVLQSFLPFPHSRGRFGIEFTNGDAPGVKLTAPARAGSDHWAVDQSRARSYSGALCTVSRRALACGHTLVRQFEAGARVPAILVVRAPPRPWEGASAGGFGEYRASVFADRLLLH